KPETLARFAKEMDPFVRQSLNAKQYVEVRKRLDVLDDVFRTGSISKELSKELELTADGLVAKADQAMRTDNKADVAKLLRDAELVWPRHEKLSEMRTSIDRGNYKPLNVGVRRLPEFLTPDKASTEAERQAIELLFEGLIKPISEADKGTRYAACLAADRPRQI